MYSLDIYVDPSYADAAALHSAYTAHVASHNLGILDNGGYADSGFDLLVPETTYPDYDDGWDNTVMRVDHRIVVAMRKPSGRSIAAVMRKPGGRMPSGFYIYPRSSIATKKRLRLANSVGIIDAGYQGSLVAMFDVLPLKPVIQNNFKVYDESSRSAVRHERIVQVCAPDLSPIHVTLHPLGEVIEPHGARGAGGFGSTDVPNE